MCTIAWRATPSGATAELGAYLTSRHVSVGPTFLVDVNSIQPFWSLLLDLHLDGWVTEACSEAASLPEPGNDLVDWAGAVGIK